MRFSKYFVFILLFSQLLFVGVCAQKTESVFRIQLQNATTEPARLKAYLGLGQEMLIEKPDEALPLFEKALAIARQLDNEAAIAKSYGGMGAAYSQQQKHTEAVKVLHTALFYAQHTKDAALQTDILTQLSRDKRFLSELDSAIFYSREALAIQKKAGLNNQISNNYFEIGVAYDLKGELEKATNNLLMALDAAEKSGKESQIALVFNSLGIVNRTAGNYDKALEYYQQAKKLYEKLNDKRSLGNILHNIGDLYLNQGDFENGLKYTFQGKAIREEIADYYGLAYSYQNLAFTYFYHFKHYKQAFQSDSLAYEMRKKIGDQSGMAASLNDMAWDLLELGKPQLARENSLKALDLARLIGARTAEKNCYELLSKIAVVQGRFEEGLNLQQRFYELKDSLFNADKNRVIQELQVKYETAKKEQQLQENQLLITQRTLQRNWFFVVALLAGALALSVFLGFRSRLRYNQHLSAQAAELQAQRIRELEQTQKIVALDAMMQGQEEERRRVAKDLHDGLGGLLSSIKHHFRAVSEQSQQLDTLPVYQKTNAMLDEAHEEVRRIAHNMMPDALAKLGLVAAIEDLAESYRSANALQISVQHFGWKERLEETLEINLFRIVQELLQNIAKHAQATQVFIQLSQFDDTLTMTIEDNGVGFDLSKAKVNGGIGLKSMQSRVAYLGGTLEIETAPGKGTVSIIQIPLKVKEKIAMT